MINNNILPVIVLISVVLIFGFLFLQSISQQEIENVNEVEDVEDIEKEPEIENLEPEIEDEENSMIQERDDEVVGEEFSEAEEVFEEELTMGNFINCLVEEDVVVYASRNCPACNFFASEFGGYEKVEDLFVECGADPQRCSSEKQTGYVPEIQIRGELYDGSRELYALSEETECALPVSL